MKNEYRISAKALEDTKYGFTLSKIGRSFQINYKRNGL